MAADPYPFNGIADKLTNRAVMIADADCRRRLLAS